MFAGWLPRDVQGAYTLLYPVWSSMLAESYVRNQQRVLTIVTAGDDGAKAEASAAGPTGNSSGCDPVAEAWAASNEKAMGHFIEGDFTQRLHWFLQMNMGLIASLSFSHTMLSKRHSVAIQTAEACVAAVLIVAYITLLLCKQPVRCCCGGFSRDARSVSHHHILCARKAFAGRFFFVLFYTTFLHNQSTY